MTWLVEVFERLTTKAEAVPLTEMDAGDTEQLTDVEAAPQARAAARPLLRRPRPDDVPQVRRDAGRIQAKRFSLPTSQSWEGSG